MWRFLFVAALAAAIWTDRPALAQPSSSKDDVKKLEAELDKLRSQTKDVEARLQKAKDDKRPSSPRGQFGSWGRMDPDQMKKMMEQFGGKGGMGWGRMDADQMKKMMEQFMKPAEKKEAKKDDKRAASPWGYSGSWSGRDFRRPSEATKSSDLERRMDRLLKEVEELRPDIKKK